MKYLKESFIESKKSKFYGYLYNINNEDEIKEIIKKIKLDNKKAKHVVYAYKIGNIEKKYEDKEPSGTSGLQILNSINLKKMDNTLIVIVRYFGGTLLGTGLLSRCYRETASKLFD